MSPNPRGNAAVHWAFVLGIIDTLAVILRFIVRKTSKTKIGSDDWMIMASLVPAYSMIAITILLGWKGGAGKHKTDVTDSEMTMLLMYIIPAMITYGLTITAVKISILLLYRRVFDTVNFKRAILVVGFLCITWLCGDVFTEIFLCFPMSDAWDPKLMFSNHCRDFQAFLLGITVSNLLLDVIILCMPLPMIWGLKLSTRKKLQVSGVFLLGSFTCISSLIRILSIRNIKDEDFSYTFLTTYLWSSIEPATAIWCACLMTYRPLFIDIPSKLRTFFADGKFQPLFRSKTSSACSSSSDTWSPPSLVERNLYSPAYQDLSPSNCSSAKDGNPHAVAFSRQLAPADRVYSPPPAEWSRVTCERRVSSPV